MKNCPRCNAQLNDDAVFCTNCGTTVNQNQTQPNYNQAPNGGFNQNPQYTSPFPTANPTDHTDEFSAAEVADNKLFAVLAYVSIYFGIIIALIANMTNHSNYLKFHIKQALKLSICETVIVLVTLLLSWTFVMPVLGIVALIMAIVVNVICIVQTLRGQSIEPPIISEISFLK